MPIVTKKDGSISIPEKEYSQIESLQSKIKNGESITEFLNEIDSSDLNIILNLYMPYITDDLSNTDYLAPVHVAAKYGNLEALKVLFSKGAKFNVYTENYGRSPLHFAGKYNHPDIVEYFVTKHQMSVDAPAKDTHYYDSKNITPLFECATRGSIEAALKLISLGANVNYQNSKGYTALHYACEYGFSRQRDQAVILNFIDILLKNGANSDLKGSGSFGLRAPIDVIRKDDNRAKVEELLIKNKLIQSSKQVSPISMFKSKQQAITNLSGSIVQDEKSDNSNAVVEEGLQAPGGPRV